MLQYTYNRPICNHIGDIMKIKLITDSMCNLTTEYAKEHNIDIIRLSTILDDVIRIEGDDGTWTEYYEALKASKSFPKTSQPSPLDMEETFKKALEEGYTDVLYLSMASLLSGTYQTATMVANQLDPQHIHVVDTHQLSLGQFFIVEKAVDMIEAGKDIKEIVSTIENYRDTVTIDFVPVTMEYLKRGGRVSGILATIANVINLKPILCMKANLLTNVKKVFGMMKGIAELVARIPEKAKKAYVLYIHDNALIDKFLAQLKLKRPNTEFVVRQVGPVLGSHVGIGAIGTAYEA